MTCIPISKLPETNKAMRTQTFNISHARNALRPGAGEVHVPLKKHGLDYKKTCQLKVDDWDFENNTIYEYH